MSLPLPAEHAANLPLCRSTSALRLDVAKVRTSTFSLEEKEHKI